MEPSPGMPALHASISKSNNVKRAKRAIIVLALLISMALIESLVFGKNISRVTTFLMARDSGSAGDVSG